MKLEVRVPISVRPAWLNRMRLIAASIRRFYPDAVVTAFIGEPGGVDAGKLAMAAEYLHPAHISMGIVSASSFDAWKGTRSEYLATMMARYEAPFMDDTTHVLMLDADVLCCRGFDGLSGFDGIQGVMTHVAPWDMTTWGELYHRFDLPPPGMLHQHSGYPFMGGPSRFSPFYPNSGVVFGTKTAFEAISKPYMEAIAFLRRTLRDTYWFDQVGLTLGIAAANVPTRALPIQYNMPNQKEFEDAYPAVDPTFLHFLRTDMIHRDRDFENFDSLFALCGRTDMGRMNDLLAKEVRKLLGPAGFYGTPLTSAADAPWA